MPQLQASQQGKHGELHSLPRRLVPYDIVSRETRHDRPIPGDNGIQWEAAPDAPLGLPEGWTMADALRLEAILAG